MSVSIKFDKYLFTLTKRNDSCLTMTGQTELENSIFESAPIELKRIKFDTVVAALNKQNEKNLFTKVLYEAGKDAGTGKLLLSIVVRYDFLPEFSEEIILNERRLNENDSLKVKLNSLENELSGLEKIIKSIETDGVIKYSNAGELRLQKGKHLIQISGLYKGTHQGERLEFSIVQDEDKKETKLIEIVPYFLSSPYSFPYSLSEAIELDKERSISIVTKANTTQLMNHLVTAKPIVN